MTIRSKKPIPTKSLTLDGDCVMWFEDGTFITFKRGQGIEPIFSRWYQRRIGLGNAHSDPLE